MTKVSEYNTRQFGRMLDAIAAYDGSLGMLREIISTLDSLLSALEGVSDELRQSIRGRWGVLEEVYAYALSMDVSELDDTGQQLVRTNLQALREQIEGVVE